MNYKEKIIDFDKAGKFFKKIKVNKKIIHCHGVFDLVHPGHIRHLSYCKSKADILVVSITPDKFIKKGIYRPLVPEKIRANNLSVLELVDYVIIDKFKHPYNIIKKIKPNYFAKGNEYFNNPNLLTEKENKTLKKFGGKMLFTPGDVVFSSTKIINENEINLKYDKLKNLMDVNKYTFEKITDVIKKFKNIRVHVVGDLIIDTHIECEAVAGLHKTPTLSLIKKNSKSYLGGAGIVAAHFASFSKKVTLTTVISNDRLGNLAKKFLKKYNVNLNSIYESDRPTTEKSIFISQNHNLLKVNNVSNQPISNTTLEKIKKNLKKNNYDIAVISDYRHGIFNNQSCNEIVKSIDKKAFKVADSQVASRWGNILDFKSFNLITPTEQEARYSLFEQDLTIRALADKLIKESKSKNIILKIGERGLIALGKNRPDYIALDPFVDNLMDANGAGDALLAYSSAALFKEKSLIMSSIIGILAASCKCEKKGNLPLKISEIVSKINKIKDSMV
jgi:rfaE bifunctional protein kinase chain/domain